MILDDIDLPMKSWRNKNPSDDIVIDQSGDKTKTINKNDADDIDPFPQQQSSDVHSPHQLPKLSNRMKEESFSLSMYILLILTLIVLILFLNCYRKRRNTIRARRKWFPFNRLSF